MRQSPSIDNSRSFSQKLYETTVSLEYSQQLATASYPEPDIWIQSTPSDPTALKYVLIHRITLQTMPMSPLKFSK